MDKLLLFLCVAVCLCAAASAGNPRHPWYKPYGPHHHGPKHHHKHDYCKGEGEPGDCKPEGPGDVILCTLNDTTCGDNMTCTDSPYFLRGLTLTDDDEDCSPVGLCVNNTVDFEEGSYCCKPGCKCASGECCAEVAGNFSTNTSGVCVANASSLEECISHTDCTDPDSLCVQGNDTSYCLVPQSRPDGYECPSPGSEESSKPEGEPEPDAEDEPEPKPEPKSKSSESSESSEDDDHRGRWGRGRSRRRGRGGGGGGGGRFRRRFG